MTEIEIKDLIDKPISLCIMDIVRTMFDNKKVSVIYSSALLNTPENYSDNDKNELVKNIIKFAPDIFEKKQMPGAPPLPFQYTCKFDGENNNDLIFSVKLKLN